MLEALTIGAHRRQRRARRQQLRLGLQHVGLGRDAGVVAVLRDLQRALVAFDAARQQLDLVVGFAQREVVDRHRALRREPRRGQVGGAALDAGTRALDRAADAAPEVGRPVAGERGREGVGAAGAAGRAVAAAEAARAGVEAERRGSSRRAFRAPAPAPACTTRPRRRWSGSRRRPRRRGDRARHRRTGATSRRARACRPARPAARPRRRSRGASLYSAGTGALGRS